MRHALACLSLALLTLGCSGENSVEPTPPAPAAALPEVAAPAAPAVAELPAAKLDVNTATREQFLALPEVSPRMAHEFDEYRPYTSIRQFRREIGKYVDEAQVARYEQYLYVPIAINDCDEETLQQIPGVDATVSAAIVAGRPYDSAEALIAALQPHVDAQAIEIARGYIAE